MYNIKAIIFDMDGTMFDTEKLYLDNIHQSFKLLNIDVDYNELKTLIGKPEIEYKNFVLQKLRENNLNETMVDYDSGSEQVLKYIKTYGTPIKKGLFELLNYAKENNLEVAVATSAKLATLEFLFKNAGISKDMFSCITTIEEVKQSKPNGEIYSKSVAKLQNLFPEKDIHAENCLVIEDSYVGATAGVNAKCIVAKVSDLEITNQEKDKLIDMKFYNLLEVISFLNWDKIDCSKVLTNENEEKNFLQDLKNCRKLMQKLNMTYVFNNHKREKLIRKIFNEVGQNPIITTPFYCGLGKNIKVGDNLFTDYDCSFLDSGKIIIGNNCRFGAHSGIYSNNYLIGTQEQLENFTNGKMVILGNNVSVGANVSIMSGVKIGDNAIILAGSVVDKDVKPNTVVAGNPAEFVKYIV